MPLDGATRQVLVTILKDAFNRDELTDLVQVTLNVDLFTEFATPTTPDVKVVTDLVAALERREITATLVAGALKLRPSVQALTDFCRQCFPSLLSAPAPAGEAVDVAVAGVNVVRHRLTDPAVRQRIGAAVPRESLRQIGLRIDQMDRYKVLHDCLHEIEIRYYRQTLDAVRRFRADPAAVEELDDYLASLKQFVVKSRATAAGLPADGANGRSAELVWIGVLEAEVIQNLRSAVTQNDDLNARKAVVRLKSLLITEPSRIDGLLTAIASNLPLLELAQTLGEVSSLIPATDPAADALKAGLDELRKLHPRLVGQIARHANWQRVAKELWQADEDLRQATPDANEEFAFLWPVIKAHINALASLEPDTPWVAELTPNIEAVDRALAGNPAITPRVAFRRYSRLAQLRFFEEDLSLKDLCKAVAALGDPVTQLLLEANNGA